MINLFKKKKDPFGWLIELACYDCKISLLHEGKQLFSHEIMKPLFFLRLRMWMTKSKLRYLFYQSKYAKEI